ncbi:MAG: hypothetical protein FWE77_03780 [Clostridia bacterium]|nr:hypothetical protein [Clostridia bacterium]
MSLKRACIRVISKQPSCRRNKGHIPKPLKLKEAQSRAQAQKLNFVLVVFRAEYEILLIIAIAKIDIAAVKAAKIIINKEIIVVSLKIFANVVAGLVGIRGEAAAAVAIADTVSAVITSHAAATRFVMPRLGARALGRLLRVKGTRRIFARPDSSPRERRLPVPPTVPMPALVARRKRIARYQRKQHAEQRDVGHDLPCAFPHGSFPPRHANRKPPFSIPSAPSLFSFGILLSYQGLWFSVRRRGPFFGGNFKKFFNGQTESADRQTQKEVCFFSRTI